MPSSRSGWIGLGMLLAWGGCSPETEGTLPGTTAARHPWFPIGAQAVHETGKATVDGPLACASCHRADADTFTVVHCDQCHQHSQALTPRLHLGVADFFVDTSATTDPRAKAELRGAACYRCHPTGEPVAFSHAQIADQCSECHVAGAPFAALPKAGFTHPDVGQSDCSGCHVISSWSEVQSAPLNPSDSSQSIHVTALEPTWLNASIVAVTPSPQVIPMRMNHRLLGVDGGVTAKCADCHAQAEESQFFPGVFHASLANLGHPEPATCNACHGGGVPQGFVGPLDSQRAPASGPMRHDAVLWVNDAPTSSRLVTMDCAVCHQPPNENGWSFTLGKGDAGTATFHRSLTEAALAQPASCIDCHANGRPVAPIVRATFTFDHADALGDCVECHTATTWTGGLYHGVTSATPTTCLPCHAGDRPTTTQGWLGAYQASPFDYVTNRYGDTHGADQDCVVCHPGPGTGGWGRNANWQGGHFAHGAATVASSTCITCHSTQRPDLLQPPADAGFDHALNGTGDCVGCHEATVTRNAYVRLLPIPGGDWRGGKTYPGAALISTPSQSIRIASTVLTRSGMSITGMTTTQVSLPNAFLHTSTAIPAQLFPGSPSTPDQSTCWHCHTATGTTVTSYADGVFHASLVNFRATPDAGTTRLPQPTACLDCHRGMRPPNIVSRADAGVAWLMPMDHAATFIGGSVSGVAAMDCGTCHHTPGLGPVQWSDGKFHGNLPTGATPSACENCHYPLGTARQR